MIQAAVAQCDHQGPQSVGSCQPGLFTVAAVGRRVTNVLEEVSTRHYPASCKTFKGNLKKKR